MMVTVTDRTERGNTPPPSYEHADVTTELDVPTQPFHDGYVAPEGGGE